MIAMLGLVFVGLLVAEIAMRVVEGQRQKRQLETKTRIRRDMHLPPYAWHPFLGQVHASNFFSSTCVTDERGFRNRHRILSRESTNEFRVLLAGGSTAAGAYAPDGQTLRDALQTECERRRTGALVLNVAQSAFNSSQELVQVAVCLLDLEPDVLVLIDGRNDFYFATRSDWQPHITYRMNRFTDWYERVRQQAAGRASLKSALVNDLRDALKASALLRVAYGLTQRRAQAREQEARRDHEDVDQVRRAALGYCENIRRIAALLATSGCRFYLFMQPSIFDTSKRLSDRENILADALSSGGLFYESGAIRHYSLFAECADDVLRALAAEHRFVYQNCIRMFDHMGSDVDAFVDDAHLTPEGQAVLARAVFRTIESALCGDPPDRDGFSSVV